MYKDTQVYYDIFIISMEPSLLNETLYKASFYYEPMKFSF